MNQTSKDIRTLTNMQFEIRKALSSDCPSIQSLIQELADYEKFPNGPKLSAEDLIKDGFGESPFFHCFVADVTTESQTGKLSKVVGYALYFYTYSTWDGRAIYMEDLFVTKCYRGKGLGTALWKAVSEEGLKNGCCRMDFVVLNWNSPSIKFYKDNGAIDMTTSEGWNLFRLQKEQMEKL